MVSSEPGPTPPLLSSNLHSFPTSDTPESTALDPSSIQLHSIQHTPVPIDEEAKDYVTVKELRNEGALLFTDDVDPTDVVNVEDDKNQEVSTGEDENNQEPFDLDITVEALKNEHSHPSHSSSNQFVVIEHTPLYTPPVHDSGSLYDLNKTKASAINDNASVSADTATQSLEELIDSQMASMTELSSSLKQSISTKRFSASRSPTRSRSRQPSQTPAPFSPSKDASDEKLQNKVFETPNLLNRGGSYSGVAEYRQGGTSSHSLFDSPSEYRAGRTSKRASEVSMEDREVEEDPMERMRSGSRDYLRSISRSRTSISRARGQQRDTIIDEVELENEGALINDAEFNLELERAQNGVIDNGKDKDEDLIGKLEREIGLFEVKTGASKSRKKKSKSKNKKKKSTSNVNTDQIKEEEEAQVSANQTSASIPVEASKEKKKEGEEEESKEQAPEIEEPKSKTASTTSGEIGTPSVVETTDTAPAPESNSDDAKDSEEITQTAEEPIAEEESETSTPAAVETLEEETQTSDSQTKKGAKTEGSIEKDDNDEDPVIEEPLAEEISKDEAENLVAIEQSNKEVQETTADLDNDEFTVEEPIIEEIPNSVMQEEPTLNTSSVLVEETEESSIHSKDDIPEVEESQNEPDSVEELNSGGEVEEIPDGEVTEVEEHPTVSETKAEQSKGENKKDLNHEEENPIITSSTTGVEEHSSSKTEPAISATIHDEAERLIKELEADLGGVSISGDHHQNEQNDETSKGKEDDIRTSPLKFGSMSKKNSIVVKEEEPTKKEEKEEEKEKAPIKEEQKQKQEPKSKDLDLDEIQEPTREEIIEMLKDEPVYIYTSLAGGGFHMPQRTNRLVTILTANRIPFKYRDLGTDEEARNVWRRHSNGKSLPGVVRGKDDVIGNWEVLEELNEEYKVHEAIYETL